MIDVVLFFVIIFISFYLFKNIHLGFAMVIALDLLIIRSVTFVGLPLREILMIITWCAFLYYKKGKISVSGLYKKHFIVFSIGILIIFFLSAKEPGLSFQLKHIFGLIYYFSYAYIAWQIYNSLDQLARFRNVLFICISFMAVYGVFCYITSSNPYLNALEMLTDKEMVGNMMLESRGGLMGRIQSTMAHPLTWGGCACLFAFYFYETGIRSKYILPMLLVINTFLTGSRSVIIALFIALLFIILFKKKIRILLSAAVCVGVIIVAIYNIPFFDPYKGFIESTVFFWDDGVSQASEIQGSSTSMRELQFVGTIAMIKDNLLFGLGHGYVDYYFVTSGAHPILLGFESLIFNKLVEGGFFNLFLWFYLFGVLFFSVAALKKKYSLTEDTSVIKGYVAFYFVYSLFTGFMLTFLYFIVLYAVLLKYMIAKNKIKSDKLLV